MSWSLGLYVHPKNCLKYMCQRKSKLVLYNPILYHEVYSEILLSETGLLQGIGQKSYCFSRSCTEVHIVWILNERKSLPSLPLKAARQRFLFMTNQDGNENVAFILRPFWMLNI